MAVRAQTVLDFMEFARAQCASSDFDAEHPVCRWLAERDRLDTRARTWLCVLYMAFYDEASAWATFQRTDPFTMPERGLLGLPIGKNRRNLWGGKIRRHFESLLEVSQTAPDWPCHDFQGIPEDDWDRLGRSLGTVWGNGRFARYTTAEMLHKVAESPVVITGFDNKDSSGPADGIVRLYGCARDLPSLDRGGDRAYQLLQDMEVHPTYTTMDRGVAESILCTYGATCRGKFYSGRNLDRQQGRILTVESMGYDLKDLWDAREASLDRRFLGEFNSWTGVNKDRLRSYPTTGKILWPHHER